MTNLEILKKAFEMSGYDCEFEEGDGKLVVTLNLIGSSHEFIFSATYDEDVDLDYVISTLKTDFNYNETISNEESWCITIWMENYIQEPENNGCWILEGMINSWKLEEDGIKIEWDNFESDLEKALDRLIESYEIEAKYGTIDWNVKPNCKFDFFIEMCAGDMCAFPSTIVDSLVEELDDDEKVNKYVMKKTEDGNVYLVKTTEDRVICLNHLC